MEEKIIEKKWYEFDQDDRIKNVFSKYTIQQFWDFWSNKETHFMEVRIKDVSLIKQVAQRFQIPYSMSGVYVKDAKELKNVIGIVREKAVLWFGINSRKKNWSFKVSFKSFGSGKKCGSSDENVASINFIFIDIDRKKKQGQATKADLKDIDLLADSILERFCNEDWNKGFMKICSGNGVQLIIKLDFPIKVPDKIFDSKMKLFEVNDEFDKIKDLIKEGIGKQILRFANKFIKENKLNADLDKSVFNLRRVGALPFTKNFKYDSFTWRGIIDMHDQPNIGLTDYLFLSVEDNETFKKKNIFVKSSGTKRENMLSQSNFHKHPLVRFLLDSELPYGGINNKLWFMLKILLRDSKFDLNSKLFRKFHQDIERKVKGNLPTNLPDKKFEFSENVVNSYCIENFLPPLYQIYSERVCKYVYYDNIEWDNLKLFLRTTTVLDDDTDMNEDIQLCKFRLRKIEEGLLEDHEEEFAEGLKKAEYHKEIYKFINGCINKYGNKKTRYYFDYIFERMFNYK